MGRWRQEIMKQHPKLCCEGKLCWAIFTFFKDNVWNFWNVICCKTDLRIVNLSLLRSTCSSWDTKELRVPERAALLERRVPASEKSLLMQWVDWQSLPPAPKYQLFRTECTHLLWQFAWWWRRYVQPYNAYYGFVNAPFMLIMCIIREDFEDNTRTTCW